MNAKQRKAIAERIKAIAEAHGGQVEIDDYLYDRCTIVRADFVRVSVSMDVDDLHKGGQMAHWFGAKGWLNVTAFDSVNECHGRNATQYRDNLDDFCLAFERACRMVADGSAFVEAPQRVA